MNATQEALLDILTALRNWEASENDDAEADQCAVEAVVKGAATLYGFRWRIGADGKAQRI